MDGAAADLSAVLTGPFPLPPAYEQAKDRTVHSVADLRTAVKQVSPCAVQAAVAACPARQALSVPMAGPARCTPGLRQAFGS